MLRNLIIALALPALSLFACTHRGVIRETPAEQAAPDRPTVTPLSIEPAERYGGATDETLSAEESAVRLAMENRFGRDICRLDGNLISAARIDARHLTDLGDLPAGEGIDYLRFALRMAGSPDYSVEPVVFAAGEAGISRLLQLLESNRLTHCGIGLTSDGEKGVFVGVRRPLRIDSFPVAPSVDGSLSVTGEVVARDGGGVHAFLEQPSGHVKELTVWRVGDRFSLTVSFQEPGRHVLELQIDADTGPETAALVPLFAGVPIDATPTILPSFDEGKIPPEDALAQLVNRIRMQAGLHPLSRDRRLDQVALAHCRDMVEEGWFGHRSRRSGLLEDRLRAAGLHPSLAAENIARSVGVLRVHHNLMESPSHKIRLLGAKYTHMGIGIVPDGDASVVTQVFARW